MLKTLSLSAKTVPVNVRYEYVKGKLSEFNYWIEKNVRS